MLPLLRSLSLRQLLTLPYVLVVLAVTLVIGGLSYNAGRHAVDELSGQLLRETTARIAAATKTHIAGAKGVLEAAFPAGVQPPADWDADDIAALRERFWIATSIHRNPHNYAYYGDQQGRFFGLMRHADDSAELRLRPSGQGVRELHAFNGIHGALGPAQPETRVFEPRERPWYQLGLQAASNTWSPIYIDFRSQELVTTFVRRVSVGDAPATGVVATDLPLQRISEFLQQLELTPNALAMVVEPDGQIIGMSAGEPVQRDASGQYTRVHAERAGNALAADAFRSVRAFIGKDSEPRTAAFRNEQGQTIQVGYTHLRDEAGLNWWVVVAVPRADFMGDIERSAWRSLVLSLLAALAAIGVGWVVLRVVGRMLGQFIESAQLVGEGRPSPPLPVSRQDELGVLARSLSDMQVKLQTDTLTGLLNRDTFMRGLKDRFQRHASGSHPQPFAVLFIDINRFKAINDTLGHAVGDAVIREMAERLRTHVRMQDRVGRYAGDEFVVLLDQIRDPADAETVRHNLEQLLRQPLQSVLLLDPALAAMGATVGAGVCPTDATEIGDLLTFADGDMYRRKPGAAAGDSSG
ncbi:sensor domain-containing diguanylate cyclase [Ottowia beijingensis]|uniref:GGDEF domain-containing protein n=1 Tax=Ottowia beijingensis TaxID=1207057 RepID=UPI0036333087